MMQDMLNGESLHVLKHHIADNMIDIIITSPPYNVAHQYDNYHDDLAFDIYLNSMREIFAECYRVLKKEAESV